MKVSNPKQDNYLEVTGTSECAGHLANQDTMSYQIQVKGQLDQQLAAWFGDCTITYTPQGNSLLMCRVYDQAALYGALARCRDMGLTLIAVMEIVEFPNLPIS